MSEIPLNNIEHSESIACTFNIEGSSRLSFMRPIPDRNASREI